MRELSIIGEWEKQERQRGKAFSGLMQQLCHSGGPGTSGEKAVPIAQGQLSKH